LLLVLPLLPICTIDGNTLDSPIAAYHYSYIDEMPVGVL
jgi:hypothetical protein